MIETAAISGGSFSYIVIAICDSFLVWLYFCVKYSKMETIRTKRAPDGKYTYEREENMDVVAIGWLVAAILLALIEIATMGLTTIWFAGGAVIAFIASLLGANFIIQIALFLAASILLLVCTRPFAARYINKIKVNTNVDALPGRKAIVTEEVSNLKGTGYVQVSGTEWMARTEEDEKVIPKEKLVKILRVSGVKLIVTDDLTEKKEKTEEQ